MKKTLTRRDFVRAGAAASLAASVPRSFAQGPTLLTPKSSRPVVISSPNGNFFKNGGKEVGLERAFALMTGGKDVLESLIAGVNIVELDPEEDSVGYGGLPNAEGVVQLDSCCMHGPKKRAGGVAALEGVRTPSLVAHAVLQQTDHHLLVGKGAQSFARNLGFTIEDDLNTEHSRKLWLEWKRRTDPGHYLDPDKRTQLEDRARREMVAEGLLRSRHLHGTINCDGLSPKGELAGVTTTSGLAWKIPGRVGDSPILGAGLYVDPSVGAAGSTGRGEANLYGLVPGRRADAPGQVAEGRRPRGAAPDPGEHHREAPPERSRPAEIQPVFLRAECEGRVRRRRALCRGPGGARLGGRSRQARALLRLRRKGPAHASVRGFAARISGRLG